MSAGEDPCGVPNNLMPFVAQVAVGRRDKLTVFGDNYDTPDGTGVRDYLHVCDLAEGHLAALRYIERAAADTSDASITEGFRASGLDVFNLGTGNGASVLEMIAAMEKASGKKVNYVIGARRSGDIDTCYANTTKAERYLQWKSKKTLDDMCSGSLFLNIALVMRIVYNAYCCLYMIFHVTLCNNCCQFRLVELAEFESPWIWQ